MGLGMAVRVAVGTEVAMVVTQPVRAAAALCSTTRVLPSAWACRFLSIV